MKTLAAQSRVRGRYSKVRAMAAAIIPVFAYMAMVFFYGAGYQLPGNILPDPFHDGEYFAAYLGLTLGPAGPHMLNLHGGFEVWLPSLCSHIFGRAYYALPVFACYRGLDLISSAIAYMILRQNMGHAKWGELAAFSTFLAAPFLVGYRELPLLLAIWLFQLAEAEPVPARRWCLETMLGAVLCYGLFWSFNFGITAASAVGLACCLRGISDRAGLARVAGAAALTLAILAASGWVSVPDYVANLLFDQRNSWYLAEQAGAGLGLKRCLKVCYILVFCLALLVPKRAGLSRHNMPANALLAGLAYWLFQYCSYHTDEGHFIAAMFGVILVVACWYGRLSACPPAEDPRDRRIGKADIARLVLFMLVVELALFASRLHVIGLFLPFFVIGLAVALAPPPALFSRAGRLPDGLQTAVLAGFGAWVILAAFVRPIPLQNYGWLGDLRHPPANATLVAGPVRGVAAQLVAAGDHCVFDLSNSGLIDMAANLPPCTRFSYLIYVPPSYQDEMITALAKAAPPVIVYSSTLKSYDFEGESMARRYPRLDAYLRATYKYEQCNQGYCVRSRGG